MPWSSLANPRPKFASGLAGLASTTSEMTAAPKIASGYVNLSYYQIEKSCPPVLNIWSCTGRWFLEFIVYNSASAVSRWSSTMSTCFGWKIRAGRNLTVCVPHVPIWTPKSGKHREKTNSVNLSAAAKAQMNILHFVVKLQNFLLTMENASPQNSF